MAKRNQDDDRTTTNEDSENAAEASNTLASAPHDGDQTQALRGAERRNNASQSAVRKFDASRLRLPANYAATSGVSKQLLVVPIRKATRHEWVQFNPDPAWRMEVFSLILKEERETHYIVDPDVQPALAHETVPVLLVCTVNVQGSVFLTPVRLPGADGRQNDWHRSLMDAVDVGTQGQWVRIVANMSIGGYDIYRASGDIGPVTWPDTPFEKLLEIALRNNLIDSIDHPVVKKLRGER